MQSVLIKMSSGLLAQAAKRKTLLFVLYSFLFDKDLFLPLCFLSLFLFLFSFLLFFLDRHRVVRKN